MGMKPDDLAGLRDAVVGYIDHLLLAECFPPGATAGARYVLGVSGVGESSPHDLLLGWADFLLTWPAWRAHRLERRLALPPSDRLADLAGRLRQPELPPEAVWEAADLLDAIATVPPDTQAALDRAAELGREVDNRLAAQPDDWPPARLARAAMTLGEWPRPPGLLDWLCDQATAEADGLGPILDELAKLEPTADPAHLAARDDVLALVRGWAADIGLAVAPADRSFAAGGPAPPAGSPGVAVKPVFRRDVPAGLIVRVKAFGLVRGEEVIRPAEVVISAGPPPPGLTELEAAAGAIPGPAGEEVRAAFRDLRPAGAGGYGELAAVELFTRFWDQAYPEWAANHSAAAAAFADGLGRMLAAGYGLAAFAPLHYRDHPAGWVVVPAGTRMTTGRVVRVLRPGLVAGDALRLPARVEAE
ncbi:MAG: hypothetical protein K2X87_05605 [Gemmataceae bacterium]|nr:hypothetical protein [Gemmataceae bacterium]